MVYSDTSTLDGPSVLVRLSVDTLETQPLTSPPAHWTGDFEPAYSPDGQMLAFVRMGSANAADLYLMPAAGGEPRRLTFDNQPIRRPAWTPDGRSIVFRSARAGAGSLWRVSVDGGEPESLGVGGSNASQPAISPKGQRLAYVNVSAGSSIIWRLDLVGAPGKIGSRTELISSTALNSGPQISPDGKRIAFESNVSGFEEVWVCDSDGANPIQLTTLGRYSTGTPRWSPDGRFIAFDTRVEEQADIYVIGANGGVPRRLTQDPSDDVVPSWSRDGRWIYFASRRTGDYQVWKMPAEGGEAVVVTERGGFAAFESPDGAWVYYAKGLAVPGLWRVPTEGGAEELVLDKVRAGWGHWAVVDDGVYFAEAEGKTGAVIEFFSFATRRVTRVGAVVGPPFRWVSGLAVSPDKRWLLYLQHEPGGSDIMLVENFQ